MVIVLQTEVANNRFYLYTQKKVYMQTSIDR
jgi:hypothetical protein